ncbi:MAG: rhamnulokinase [Sphaerochaetaceae bacterium]|nr:rhamnulokinase [Sphaerochaetaceae bacterium]
MNRYAAVDLGASNGRVIVGSLEGIEVVHRFVTENVRVGGSLYWDALGIFREIKKGLAIAFSKYGNEIKGIGVDTWGVDYALVDREGMLVSPIFHYRDDRTDGVIDEVCALYGGREKVYGRTGIAFQSFDTIYQLYAHKKFHPEAFAAASRYLSFPDLICYWLSGVMANELTHASTTQLYDPVAKDWAWDLIDAVGFPRSIFGQIVPSGTVLGPLCPEIASEIGAGPDAKVIAIAAHDTASAVAAVPAKPGENNLFLSSGTWSLLGSVEKAPRLSKQFCDSGFTNEIASDGQVRLLENIMGMWIQQECLRHWETEGPLPSWKELDDLTLEASKHYHGAINCTDPRFLKPNAPGNLMEDRIRAYLKETSQALPSSKPEFMVAIYRGLAVTYKTAIVQLEKLLGKKFDSLSIIGGGCKNQILDQWAADETGLAVYAGPVEATALGNILVQELALGQISSLAEGKEIIRKAFAVKEYHRC